MSEPQILSGVEIQILTVLSGGEMYGREIRKNYLTRFGHEIKYGTMYITLERMVDKGFFKT